MRLGTYARIGVATLAVVLGIRAISLQVESFSRAKFTQDLCNLVGNYLETSSDRSAFEGMQQAIYRSAYPNACVSIIDQGRNYSPDCVQPGTNYQLTVCKVDGNVGIRAEVYYPVAPFFTSKLLLVWLASWVTAILVLIGIRELLTYFSKRITEELWRKLFPGSDDKPSDGRGVSFAARIAQWAVVRSGILQGVRTQSEQFETRIREYEDRVRAEAARRAQKEVEVERSRERLDEMRKIRHDLGSPLASFLSVQEKFAGDEHVKRALASGIWKIQKMLDRLSETDASNEMPRLTLLEPVAEEAIAFLADRFQSTKGVRLDLQYDPSELSPVSATPEGLTRILNNLLENAFDASATEGLIQVAIRSDSSQCRISVEDRGCGIPADLIPRLFEKGATFGKVNGTGYGLYQAKILIESWQGKIELEPLERGTRFTTSFPRLQAGVRFVGLPKTKRLWVIDDDPSIAEILDQSGYEVVASATSYTKGEDLLNRGIPENVVVLLDYRLGDTAVGTDLVMGGRETAQIYLCTNDYDNPETLKKARAAGLRVLPKPLCFSARTRSASAVLA